MKIKNIPPNKMHLLAEFHAAQENERKMALHIENLKEGGASIDEETLEMAIQAQRRTIAALMAIQNLP